MITLKEILNEVQERAFETVAVTYSSNQKPDVRRLVTYANQAVRKLLNAHKWSFLKKLATITVVDGTTLYALPTDYFSMVNDTMYRGSTYIPMNFPANAQDVALQKNYNVGRINTGRLYQGQIELINFAAGDVTYEYNSNGMVLNDATYGLKFDDDNAQFGADYAALDELIVLATLALYLRGKEVPGASIAVEDYTDELRQQIINDQGSRIIKNIGTRYDRLVPPFNPDYESGF